MDLLPLLIVAIPVLLLWNMASRARRQQRDMQTVQEQLVPGSEVMTSSGLFAKVVSLEDERVVLETGPGQESTWDKRAVVKVITAQAEVPSDDDSEAETA